MAAVMVESPPIECPISLSPATATTLQNEAYIAAREGSVRQLKRLWMDVCARKDEIDPMCVFSARNPRHRHSPLIAACKYNRLHAAQFLLKTCGVAIEDTGDVQFSEAESVVLQAAPLWTAASSGHTRLVRYLISEGADINHATKTGSTPVRGACYDGFLDVVRALVKHGADINKANECGQTPLMVAVGRGHSRVANFLLSCQARVDITSREGFTAVHICAASERGHWTGLESLCSAGAKLDKTPDGWSVMRLAAATGNEQMVAWLRSQKETEVDDIILSLELLGATMLDKRDRRARAMYYWREAHALRQKHRMQLTRADVVQPMEAYEMRVEALTVHDFDTLENDENWMDMHSLLVRERILGFCRPTAYFIRRRGMQYLAMQCFERCSQLWLHALSMHQVVFRHGDTEILQILHNCVIVFRDMALSDHKAPVEPFVLWTLAEAEAGEFVEPIHATQLYKLALHLLSLWHCQITDNDAELLSCFMDTMERFWKCAWRQSISLLHLAACAQTALAVGPQPSLATNRKWPRFPSPSLVRTFLDIGVPPDFLSQERKTPLQVLFLSADMREGITSPADVLETATALLACGAHLDARGPSGHDIIAYVKSQAEQHNVYRTFLQFLTTQYCRCISLKCMAARVITTKHIPFHRIIPQDVVAFVELH